MSPGFPGREGSIGQEGGEATLQSVGAAADRVRGVAIVTAFAVETEVAGRTDEEGLEQLAIGDVINFRRHVEGSTAHRHRSAKSQEPARANKEPGQGSKDEFAVKNLSVEDNDESRGIRSVLPV